MQLTTKENKQISKATATVTFWTINTSDTEDPLKQTANAILVILISRKDDCLNSVKNI